MYTSEYNTEIFAWVIFIIVDSVLCNRALLLVLLILKDCLTFRRLRYCTDGMYIIHVMVMSDILNIH